MPTTTITDWGEAVMTSPAAAMALFFGAIPKVIGFVVILLVGWFIAALMLVALPAVIVSIVPEVVDMIEPLVS